ncbi:MULTISPECIES: ricin-type beta-trefoil lectin domain protein [unclassified Streptomyces]|uniref:ricin-type beta-trefoil lectin domain protein n=1 Tax=unclassified Streptomyces TaxID=2593676 RepID=UPI0036EB733C
MPESGDRAPVVAGEGTSLPRLTQFSSLGSRGNTDRGPVAASVSSGAGGRVDTAAGDRPGGSFGRRGDAGRNHASDIVVPLAPAGRPAGRKARREGFSGALAVVAIVGLLSAGSVWLTLGLVNGDNDHKRDGASVVIDSDGHGMDAIDELGGPATPSVSVSGGKSGKKSDSPAKHTSASPTGSASSEEPVSSGEQAITAPKEPAKAEANAQAAAPGVAVFSHASRRCIDVVGGKAVRGAPLMIWDCSASASQHWTFAADGTMRALGMCVRLTGSSTADGTDLELAACDAGSAQRFVLNSSHDLVSGLADKCVDVRDNGTANGTRLQLWSCSGDDNQKWSKG